ncbi:MAG: response regulator [Dehalococcoidia bacterium]
MIPKILVVEDNDSITLLLSLTLKTEGYDVEPAADGMESFQKFQLNEPEVLVTGLVMPEMDGQELCRRVRKISGVPILIITGDLGGHNDADTQRHLRANGYLAMPFDLEDFAAQVKSLLTNWRENQSRPQSLDDEAESISS